MKQFVILLVWTLWGALLVACSHDIRENGLENVTYNAVQDVDGNSYDAVQIGDQVWMRTNLRTRHFRDGGVINIGYDYHNLEPVCFEPIIEGADFGDHEPNCFQNYEVLYGLLYNWYAVGDKRGLCPEGWHVPSDAEWYQLKKYVESHWCCYNGYSVAKALASQYGWRHSNNIGAPGRSPEENNASGFGAIPAGSCSNSWADSPGHYAYFWSSTQGAYEDEAYYFNLYCGYEHPIINGGIKGYGYSLRCLRD